MKQKIKILAISGSLRAASSNNIIIKIVAGMAPADVSFVIYDGLADLPPFNDVDNEPVEKFRHLLREADGIFFCIPEYALGMPGALKNALDWTVSTGDFDKKAVALVTAATGGEKAHASFLLTLTALSADVVPGGTLLVSFVRSKINEKGEIADPGTYQALKGVLDSLVNKLRLNF